MRAWSAPELSRCNVTQPPGFNPERLPEIIEETHKRLARVQIECLPYEKVLEQFRPPDDALLPRPAVLRPQALQLQPRPGQISRDGGALGRLQGKFVLSLNDVPEVRAIFKAIQDPRDRPRLHRAEIAGRRYREVLITNF